MTQREKCKNLDDELTRLRALLAHFANASITDPSARTVRDSIQKTFTTKKLEFISNDCRNELDYTVIDETVDILVDNYKKNDSDITPESDKKRVELMLIGGGVLIIGLLIIL